MNQLFDDKKQTKSKYLIPLYFAVNDFQSGLLHDNFLEQNTYYVYCKVLLGDKVLKIKTFDDEHTLAEVSIILSDSVSLNSYDNKGVNSFLCSTKNQRRKNIKY